MRAGAERFWGSASIAFALMLPTNSGSAQTQAATAVPGLGSLRFQVTTSSPTARASFLRGTMLLHLFHYDEAIAAFRSAQRVDPGMTMAWWGEAMASNYGVWNQQFPDSARAALKRLAPTPAARATKARSRRERDYLATVEVLYGPGTKPHRDTLYAAAMAKLSQQYPADDEAKLFHALALLSLNQGVRDTVTYRRAFMIANEVLLRQPEHSGAAHYVIHATDDPEHAVAGLPAARQLARSAPAADHAQHMTSHIFMARGMWDDLVAANQRATHTDGEGHAMPGMRGGGCGHYDSWLHYGYLAQGRIPLATALLERCQAFVSKDTTRSLGGAIGMWARHLIDTEEWRGSQANWHTPQQGDSYDRQTWHFVHGFAAARRGDIAMATSDLTGLQGASKEIGVEIRKENDDSPESRAYLKRTTVLDLELQAAIASARGDRETTLRLLQRAVVVSDSIPYAFGPPFIEKPAHEFLGEELLAAGRRSEAATEFARALRETPNRPLALRGAARAAGVARP